MKTMKAKSRVIRDYMTANPHTIGKGIPIKKALEMMREYRIRHLPVQDAGKLVGILTDRDLKLASSFEGAWDFRSEDIMTPDAYAVSPDAPLSKVVEEMAEHKYGSVIVQEPQGKVVGIFTSVDALKVLSELLAA